MPIYTFRMDAHAYIQAPNREAAWEALGTLPDNAWELDYPELVDESCDEDE